MRIIITLITIFLAMVVSSVAQNRIKIDFPSLPDKHLQMLYSYGNKIDTFNINLNNSGQADVIFPDKDFRGLVQLSDDRQTKLTLFIAGDPELEIVCHEPVVNSQTITFPESAENTFFNRNQHLNARLLERLGWLQAGLRLYDYHPGILVFLQQESVAIQDSLQTLDYELKNSPLYAARIVQWISFINRMYEAIQRRDQAKMQATVSEMETIANINALYTSGQLWSSVNEMYFGLFDQMNTPDKQAGYAASIKRIAVRLTGDVQENFLGAAVVQCDRYNWKAARELLVQYLVILYRDKEVKSPQVQRLIEGSKVQNGVQAPAIAGLAQPVDQPLLVIFYESGCHHCQEQLTILKENYPKIREKGIRIVSISSDESQEVYEYHSKDFPWKDKLCDYKGFAGINFINYGVLGTPTIYRIDKNGIIQGRFPLVSETGILNE